jgi:hypothetical protein
MLYVSFWPELTEALAIELLEKFKYLKNGKSSPRFVGCLTSIPIGLKMMAHQGSDLEFPAQSVYH